MKVLTQEQLLSMNNGLENILTKDTVIVYPTDTIYGLGWLMTPKVVDTINIIKQRPLEKHFSIIAPSFEWVREYFEVDDDFEHTWYTVKKQHPKRWLTLVVKLKPYNQRPHDKDFSILSRSDEIGIRFIDHPLQEVITRLDKPIITTSANISGYPPISHIDQLTIDQQHRIDYAIDQGILDNPPSRIIRYSDGSILRE